VETTCAIPDWVRFTCAM